MPIERVFLDWDGPALPRAARWLLDRYDRRSRLGENSLVVVTPGQRSGRRLLELLHELGGPHLLNPSAHMVTPAGLFDYLVAPPAPYADSVHALLARLHCLRESPPEILGRMIPAPPDRDDWRAWFALGQDFQALDDALASDAVTFDAVLAKCREMADFDDQERWEVIADLQHRFDSILGDQGFCSRNAVLRDGTPCRPDRHADLVLVAVADPPRAIRRLLASYPGRVFALIHAPASEAAAFDEAGCLVPDQWAQRHVPIDPTQVAIVDRPRDQAHEALRQIKNLAQGPTTIGLGDPGLAPSIERMFEMAGVPAHGATGRPVVQTRPGLFLQAWARYLRTQRFDSFAALLRHPDVELFLGETSGEISGKNTGGGAAAMVQNTLTRLDGYLSEHVQSQMPKEWLGKPDAAGLLEAVRQAIDQLAPAHAPQKRPLPEWSQPISAALAKLYARIDRDNPQPEEASLVASLEVFEQALAEQAALNPQFRGDSITPNLDLADAITLTLAYLRPINLPPESAAGPAIELLGWLELQLDDAPNLILTGVNEGFIPESVNHDLFLPDALRRALGMHDNHRRYARDVLAMSAILHSRPTVRLLTGRRSAQNDPLKPSRLLLACPESELPQRVLRFYAPQTIPAPCPLPPEQVKESGFHLPLPVPPPIPLQSLEVTAFRDYLTCPYRFYLKHILGLESLDDAAVEMSPLAFGNLAHSALDDFGRSNLAKSEDAAEISAYFARKLETLCRRIFGQNPPAAVTLQRAQLQQRLEAFAHWQARQVREGWRLLGLTEKRLNVAWDVDGQPFHLIGRIDRIDQHPDLGLRILDYKTGDKGDSPDKTHRAGDAWIDLQLPLYRLLARQAGLRGTIHLGYVLLSKKLGDIGLAEADWDEPLLDSAEEEARRIIRAIRQNVFWPPAQPLPDGFAALCMDGCADRDQAIARVSAMMRTKSRKGRGS